MSRATVGLIVFVAAATLPAARADDRSVENDILEAVFRQQVTELLDNGARARGVVLCLAVDPGDAPQSVGKDLLKTKSGSR